MLFSCVFLLHAIIIFHVVITFSNALLCHCQTEEVLPFMVLGGVSKKKKENGKKVYISCHMFADASRMHEALLLPMLNKMFSDSTYAP